MKNVKYSEAQIAICVLTLVNTTTIKNNEVNQESKEMVLHLSTKKCEC